LKNKQWIVALVIVAAIAALLVWGHDRIHFDFRAFRDQMALADWRVIALAVGCIYTAYLFRSVRWAFLMRHNMRVSPLSLVGTQVIGFTAVALIGRVADPVRPYLVSKKTGSPLSTQIAVYIVERLFDFGAMALIFSVAMIWVPSSQILSVTGKSKIVAVLAANHPISAVLFARFSGLAITMLGGLFLVAIRFSGSVIAAFVENVLGVLSQKLGRSVAAKIRSFHAGLDTMRSFSDFAVSLSLSLAMWMLISVAYFATFKAFSAQELAHISFPICVLLMIASGGASIIQLPILGWFSQIGIVALAIGGILGASREAATACAATLLLVTFLSSIPIGLIWAQFENISLRNVAAESAQESVDAEETLTAEEV